MKYLSRILALSIVLFFAGAQAFAEPASSLRNSLSDIKLTTAYSDSLQEKNAQSDSLLPTFNADRAFADVIRNDPEFWSLGRVKGRKETVVTTLNATVVFIDGVREEPFCNIEKQSHAGEWYVRMGVDFVSGSSNVVHAHVQQCLDYVRDEIGYAIKHGNKVIFVPPKVFLDGPVEANVPENAQKTEPVKESSTEKPKWIWGGAVLGATYNDFYGTKFGISNIKSTRNDFDVKASGGADLLGNYWGLGLNVGGGALFLFTDNLALNAALELAFRRGSGESNVTVTLEWEDESRQSEDTDLNIEYYERQLNIDVPLTFRYIVPKVAYVEAGPLFSFNVYSKNKSVVTDERKTRTFRESGGLNVFEFGMLFGAGTMRHVGKGILDLNLRFALGLTPVCDTDDSPKTWQVQFNVGYWFI